MLVDKSYRHNDKILLALFHIALQKKKQKKINLHANIDQILLSGLP